VSGNQATASDNSCALVLLSTTTLASRVFAPGADDEDEKSKELTRKIVDEVPSRRQ
jgi:hypothetical protein